MIKKIILGVVGLIVLIFGAIAVYVMTLDWNEHKALLAEGISDLVGEKVEFSGNLNVSLLPTPHIYAEDIQIINPETSEKLATIKKLSTSVSLISVLKKVPNIQTLEVDGMELWLKIKDNGRTNWDLSHKPDFLNDDGGSEEIKSFSLQNSKVYLEDERNDLNFDLDNFTADIQAYSLRGPYRLDGNFTMQEEPFAMSVGLGSISKEDDMSLSANITHPKSKSFLRYDGTWNIKNKRFQGVVSGSSEKTASFLNVLAGKKLLDEDYDVALNFSGNMDKTEEYLDLEALVIKFEKLLNGSGNIHIPFVAAKQGEKPEAVIKYQMVDLDVRPFINIIKNQSLEYRNGKEYLPDTQINVNFDLSAVHLIVSDETGGYFESTSAKGTWKDNALTLEEFFAACPGNITLQVDGSLVEEDKKPQYYAKISIDGQNFLSWLNAIGINIKAPVQSSYRNPKLNFIITGDSQTAKLQNITLEMDKMSLKSEISIFFSDNLYQIDASADRLNLDNYISVATYKENSSLQQYIGSFLEKLGDSSLQLNLQAANLIVNGISSDNFVLNALAGKDLLNIQKLHTEGYLDSDLTLSGNFSGFADEAVKFDNVELNISSEELLNLAQNLKIEIPPYALYENKPVDITANISGKADDFDTKAKFAAGATNLLYEGKVQNYTSAEPTVFVGNVSFKTLNFSNFLQEIAMGEENFLSSVGVFNADAIISGHIKDMNFEQFDVVMGKAKYSGSGSLKTNKGKYIAKGKIKVNEFLLDNFVRLENKTVSAENINDRANVEFLPQPEFNQDIIDYKPYENIDADIDFTADKVIYADNSFEKLQTHLLNSGKVLRLDDLAYVYNGAIVKGNLSIDYREAPVASGSLDFSNIMVTNLGGTIYVLDVSNLNAKIDFKTPASSVKEAIYSLSADIMLDGREVVLHGIDLHAIAEDLKIREYSKGIFQAVRDNLLKGATSFAGLSGKIAASNGVFNFEHIELQNAEENVVLSGNFIPEEWKVKADFAVSYKELADIPSYVFSFTGTLNKPILDIDISNIAKKYDAHWEKLEKEELNKKLAEQEALAYKMSLAQDNIAPLEKQIAELKVKIENYQSKSDIRANISQYVREKVELDTIDADLYKLKTLGNTSDFTKEDVAEVNEKCAKYAKKLQEWPKIIDDLYAKDVQERADNAWKEVEQVYEDAKKLFEEYQKMIQDDFNALLEINASQYMVNNAELKTDQARLVNLSDAMVDLKDEAMSFRSASGYFMQPSEHESSIADIKRCRIKMRDILNQMLKIRRKSANMLLKIIDERRKVYQREEERKAQVQIELKKKEAQAQEELQDVDLMVTYREQQTGEEPNAAALESANQNEANSSNHNKGAIKKQYDERAQSATATQNQKTNQVLRAISEEELKETKASGTIKKSYDEDKQNTNDAAQSVLKQIDGEVKKASGTINVK